jgi:hypothetical protein
VQHFHPRQVATRLAVDTWLAQGGKRPLANYIQDAFKTLKAEIC